MELLWSLYNKAEKLRIDDLKTEHVRIILLSIPTRKMGDWYAVRGGDLRWLPIAEVPEFFDDVRVIKGAAPEPNAMTGSKPVEAQFVAPRRPMFEDAPSDLKTDNNLAIEAEETKERRSARRYPRKLHFSTHYKGDKFSCTTLNISMGGIALSENLPSWVKKTFKARLEHGGLSIRIACERVSQTTIRILDAEAWEPIRNWIVNW